MRGVPFPIDELPFAAQAVVCFDPFTFRGHGMLDHRSGWGVKGYQIRAILYHDVSAAVGVFTAPTLKLKELLPTSRLIPAEIYPGKGLLGFLAADYRDTTIGPYKEFIIMVPVRYQPRFNLRLKDDKSFPYLKVTAGEKYPGIYFSRKVGEGRSRYFGPFSPAHRARTSIPLVNKYFRKDRVVQGGYPMEMRYAGPREALLHALFRQNYGCSHLIVGRDHAGVGDYYGPFDAQKIFNEIPQDALVLRPLCMDWTFYCYECGSMASMKTCPHESKAVIDENGNYKGGARLLLSGTMLRKLMSEGKPVPSEFSRPEVIAVLKEYYDSLEEKVEVKLHKFATGETRK